MRNYRLLMHSCVSRKEMKLLVSDNCFSNIVTKKCTKQESQKPSVDGLSRTGYTWSFSTLENPIYISNPTGRRRRQRSRLESNLTLSEGV